MIAACSQGSPPISSAHKGRPDLQKEKKKQCAVQQMCATAALLQVDSHANALSS